MVRVTKINKDHHFLLKLLEKSSKLRLENCLKPLVTLNLGNFLMSRSLCLQILLTHCKSSNYDHQVFLFITKSL